MKKKIVAISLIMLLVYVMLNVSAYVYTGNGFISFLKDKKKKVPCNVTEYFDLDVNKIEQKDLYNDNLSVQIDGYTIVLEQVYYNKRDNKGYCRFSVRQKGLDMREVYIKEQPNNFQGFVLSKNSITKKDARFFFFVDADMKMGTIGEDGGFQQKKDVMYVYYMFELEGEGIKKVDYIYLYDKDAGKDGYTEFDSTPKCAAAKFKIK